MAVQNKDFETEYLRKEIAGKSNIEIVVMMYDAGIKFMSRAIEFIEQKNVEKSHYNITKAQNIVSELSHMLDMDRGGEISQNLFKLYGFVFDRLLQANVRKESSLVKEALDIFTNLREPWVELSKREKGQITDDDLKAAAGTKGDADTAITHPPIEIKQSEPGAAAGEPQPAKPAARNIFKNVTEKKEDKPHRPFSVKG